MLTKVINRSRAIKYTAQNRLPNIRSRFYLINYLRQRRSFRGSASTRAALGIVRWLSTRKVKQEKLHAYRASCFISSRSRGMLSRYSLSRVKIKPLFTLGLLFGARKSSW